MRRPRLATERITRSTPALTETSELAGVDYGLDTFAGFGTVDITIDCAGNNALRKDVRIIGDVL
ncbi:MAG: hypothetical protein J0H18_18150 [Rhizobiales bacterium]|nr:hypothetical protein [Hyphomicrobiales bacterium]OJY02027.1 MAG: hypothetical protein BGP07_14470 [Rhizobiales bacterium 63-22]